MSDTPWAPYFLVSFLIALLVLARRFARGVPRAHPRLIRIEERNLPRDVGPLAATAARSLTELGFVPLGWLQSWHQHEKVQNPFLQILRHPESATIASVIVVGDAHEVPVQVHLSTKLQDGWTVETWDGCVAFAMGFADKTRRRESWALTIGGLYRDHLRFVARQATPVNRAETSVQAMVEEDLATADENWQRFLDAGWLRKGRHGQWRPNLLHVFLNVPLFEWSITVYAILSLLRGRRWTAEIHRQRSVRPQHTVGGILDTHGLWFALLGVGLAAVLMLPKLGERNRHDRPEQALNLAQPRRGATDPLLASTRPLFGPLLPPTGASALHALVPFEDGLLGVEVTGPGRSELLWWPDPSQAPERVGSVAGIVRRLVPAPAGGRCALIVSPREEPRPEVEESVALLEREGWKQRPLTAGASPWGAAVWSPSGAQLAVAIGAGTKLVSRVYELPEWRVIASAESVRAAPFQWSNGQWLLRGPAERIDQTGPFAHYHWRVDAPPQLIPEQELAAESPDGRFRVRARQSTLVIEEGGATRIVALMGPRDQQLAERLRMLIVRWLSADRLLFDLPDPLALDLSTGKLQYLFTEPEVLLQATSPDGRWATARDEAGRYLWSTRRTD